jgi:imidazolonepropionase-like amidohydrolase
MLSPLAAATLAVALSAPAEVARPVLIENVRLAAGADAPATSILVRDGRILRIGAGEPATPVDARTIDGKGALVLPAFVDAFSFTGCATPEPTAARDKPRSTSTDVLVDMREANRKGIQPSFRAAEVFAPGDALDAWRKHGFGAILSAPHGQILSGVSALAVSRDVAPRDALLRAEVFDHAGLEATGSGYPGTLMGAIAQLRQFLLDAARHRELVQRRAAGKAGERAPFDADLDAAQELLARRRTVCAEVEDADDIDRFVKLGDEHGFALAVAGGREAWRRARVLAERKIPVILTLDWGDEADDPDGKEAQKKKKPKAEEAAWTYEEPIAARREKRRLWVERRDCARVLSEAGVPIAFGTGKEGAKELLDRVRKLVEAGLPREVALRALTDGAAAILGAAPALGRVAAGADATFALWTKDPLVDKEAQVAWLFVDGHAIELETKKKDAEAPPADGLDATGAWAIDYDAPQASDGEAELKMEKDGKVEGTLRGKAPDGSALEVKVTGRLSERTLRVTGDATIAGRSVELILEGEVEGDTWKGTLTVPQADVLGFTAKREPKEDRR